MRYPFIVRCHLTIPMQAINNRRSMVNVLSSSVAPRYAGATMTFGTGFAGVTRNHVRGIPGSRTLCCGGRLMTEIHWSGTDWLSRGREQLVLLIAEGQAGNGRARRTAARLRRALDSAGVSE